LGGGKRQRENLKKNVKMLSEKGREKSVKAKRCEGFRQVHGIHKYFDKISHWCLYVPPCVTITLFFEGFVCGLWFWAILLAVLWF